MSGSVLCERVSAALEAEAVGVESRKAWMAEEADELDFNLETFKSYLYGKTCPGLDALLTMGDRYGAAFLNSVLNPAGFHCERVGDLAALKDGRELRKLRAFKTGVGHLIAGMGKP